ncbi:circularly permuted type 2 ATP-grasp protein [Roseomonas sp. KE0001]|uniref:circularly permuted type 2 ATP-grasp protein n=1 Tax=unclassified Roseomonas TaxID=2617492 RepID=UPI0018DF78FC|nr:hypothetical protein [Roseomonas sp. KE0001]
MNALPPSPDEMVDGHGRVRPHWRGVLSALADLPQDQAGNGLIEARRRLDRASEDEGITSMLPGISGEAPARSWRCDPVPLPLPAAEFDRLAAGLTQRARLLELVLADLYGPQHLLAEGLVPPGLVFANANFLRPCRSATHPPRLPLLQSYAADLVRDGAGGWQVVADRTSRAAGLGHAQENRRMLGRVLPQLFRAQQVQPLQPFFDRWQDALQRLAPSGRENANIALLTPGVRHPLWFEHVLLARELSCALAEPGDLALRGGSVCLKTLKGLQPVDVLLRRMDGRDLDPLEFGGHAPGVPGLMDAMRHGAVRVFNAPGCGLAEAPALAALMPALCRRLLGEPLLLPSVETHWLIDGEARAMVLREPGEWVIRSAHDATRPGRNPDRMEPAAREALLERIARQPRDFAASRDVQPSQAPVAEEGRLVPQPVMLRLYLIQDGQEWQVMPGGLARVMAPGESLSAPLPVRGLAKDVWVLSEEGAQILGPSALPHPPLAIRRATGDLPSRVADNLFWLGRYVERMESGARLMRAALARLDRGPLLPREMAELSALAAMLRHARLVRPEDMPNGAAPAALQPALWRALQKGGALGNLFEEISRLVEAVRDRMTGDMHSLFTLPLRAVQVQAAAQHRGLQGLEEALGGAVRYSAGVAGVAAENMVRAGGYAFLDLGRRIERARGIVLQLGIALDQPAARAETGLRLALELCDSVITYRNRYMGVLQAAPALDLVLADPGNPRGLAFQLQAMLHLVQDLGGEPEDSLLPQVRALMAETEAMPPAILAARDGAGAAVALAPRLAAMEGEIAGLSDTIYRRYFALLPPAQTLGPEMAEPEPVMQFWGTA